MKFLYENAKIAKIDIEKNILKLSEYIAKLEKIKNSGNYESYESFINLPYDKTITEQVLDLKKRLVNPNLKYFILAGIGGSNLGTKAIYDSLLGHTDTLNPERLPKIIFLDTLDEKYVSEVIQFLENNIHNEDEFILNFVSKSGSTTESISNFEIIFQSLNKKFAVTGRTVITTDGGTKLYEYSINKGFHILTIPEKVGGRYSVFSTSSLFPLAVCDIDIESLLNGASEITEEFANSKPEENNILISALVLYNQYKNKININDNFFFNPELETLGKWSRQLMAESIGKNGIGITPTVSIGPADLHSMVQLYLGGPKDKITTFIYSQKQLEKLFVPSKENRVFPFLAEMIDNKKLQTITSAIIEGVKTSYIKQELPFTEIVLEKIDEKSIGQLMQFKMLEIICLGNLFGLNAFDQPNVESYKIETKKLLNIKN